MDPHGVAMKGESIETSDRLGQRGEGRQKMAIRRSSKVFTGAFCGNGKREGMEALAMFDELVYVLDDIFAERRCQQAAVAQSAMTELRGSLAPSHDFISKEQLNRFLDGLAFGGKIAVRDFAIIQNRLDFIGACLHAQGQTRKRCAAREPTDFLARKICRAQRRA